jgi:hypothetical protein
MVVGTNFGARISDVSFQSAGAGFSMVRLRKNLMWPAQCCPAPMKSV